MVVCRTPFGLEYEVTTNTVLDCHKAETDVNHWVFVTKLPGDTHEFLPQNQAKKAAEEEKAAEETATEIQPVDCNSDCEKLEPVPQRWQQKDIHCEDKQ